MILDVNLILSQNQNLAGGATVDSTGVIDLAGVGVGQPAPNRFGTSSSFGEDIGIGDGVSPPKLIVIVGTAFATATGATLRVQLKAAVDTNNTGNPGAYQIIDQTDDYAVGVLTAGQKIAEFTIPPRYPGQGFPRFYKLTYFDGVAASNFTAGTISFAGISNNRDDAPNYPAAY